MSPDLIQRLRTCPAEERRAAAMDLAQTGSAEAVDELIRMVEGQKRTLFRRYSSQDQLAGIEALGESRNYASLQYLRSVYTPVKHILPYGWGYVCSLPEKEAYHYPLAKGGLAGMLFYEVIIAEANSCSNNDYSEPLEDEVIEKARIETPANMHAHKVMRAAIQRLEGSLQ